MEETDDQILFELPIEMELRKSEAGDRRIVRGYASTESMDQDGEVILQNGIDFSYLMKSGFLNYDHQKREIAGATMPIIVGYPIRAEIRDKGLWVEGELLKSSGETNSEQTRLADELWELGLMFQKSGGKRSLAYSVEGGVVERKGNKITKSRVNHLAITTKPVNAEATLEVFRKSFCCGKCSSSHPLYSPGHSCGLHKAMTTESAAPLIVENLDRGMSGLLYGVGTTCDCFDAAGKFNRGIPGAVDHLRKCLGHDPNQSVNFVKKLIHGAKHRPDLAALVKAAGILNTL